MCVCVFYKYFINFLICMSVPKYLFLFFIPFLSIKKKKHKSGKNSDSLSPSTKPYKPRTGDSERSSCSSLHRWNRTKALRRQKCLPNLQSPRKPQLSDPSSVVSLLTSKLALYASYFSLQIH